MTYFKELTKGIWKENPVLRLLLGMCPALAVTSSAFNGAGMGICTLAVLLGSNIVISILRGVIPPAVRIPCFIVIIASFVTIAQMLLKAFSPQLDEALGIFIPLIVVNCLILGRAEAFASRRGLGVSILDALGMGGGFTLALAFMGGIREILGNGTILSDTPWTINLFGPSFEPMVVMVLAPGAFITLGFMLAGMNKIDSMVRK